MSATLTPPTLTSTAPTRHPSDPADPAEGRARLRGRRHHRVVRLLPLRHRRRPGLRQAVLQRPRRTGRAVRGVRHVRGRVPRAADRRADLRPLRRPDRPQEDADPHAADHGRRHRGDRAAAVVRRDRRVGPVPLVTLRVLQGIGVGGEYGGAVLLAVEYAPAKRRGFFGSFAHIGVPGGLLLASGAFSMASLLPDEAFLAWGWRACFLASIVLLAIGAYIRLSVMETPAFARVQERKEVSAVPLRDLLAASRSGCCSAWARATSRASRSTSSRSSCSPTSSPTSGCRSRWPWAGSWSAPPSASSWCRSPVRCRTGSAASRCSGSAPGSRCCCAFPVAALVQSESRGRDLRGVRGRARPGLRHGLRPARGLLVRAVRHPLPLHRAEHALPDLRHRGLRPHPADRGLAGHPRATARSGGWRPTTSPSPRSAWSPPGCCPRPGAATSTPTGPRSSPCVRWSLLRRSWGVS